MEILVVEDDDALRNALATSLGVHGFDVATAGSAEEAVVRADLSPPAVVLLDLSLPRADGFHALRRLRSFTDVPVIVLTVRDDKADKVRALDAGADDYVVKPFDLDELLARIRAALRRRPDAANELPTQIVVDDLVIDLARGQVTRGGEDVHLTPTELRLLDLLVTSDGRLLTYAQVAAMLKTDRKEIDQGTLRVFVAQLRKKLGDDATSPRADRDPLRPRLPLDRGRAELLTYNYMVVDHAVEHVRRSEARRPTPPTGCCTRSPTPPAATSSSGRSRRSTPSPRSPARYPMSFAAVQKHVAVLDRAGLVTKRRHGREQLVRGNVDAVREAGAALDRLDAVWRHASTGSANSSPTTPKEHRHDRHERLEGPRRPHHDDHRGVRRAGRACVAGVGRPASARAVVGPADLPGDGRRPRPHARRHGVTTS